MHYFLLCLALSSVWTFARCAHGIEIVVASTTQAKVQASARAFALACPGCVLDVSCVAAASGVPSQPVGQETALQGARNRLRSLPAEIQAKADYLVAVESFIDTDERGWYDQAVILIRDQKNQRDLFGLSSAVPIPPVYWQAFVEQVGAPSPQGWPVTLGEIIARTAVAAEPQVEPSDWHKVVTPAAVSRADLITDAIFRTLHTDTIAALKSKIAYSPDFPQKGVLFKDLSPLYAKADTFLQLVNLLSKRLAHQKLDAIVGLDARGFILGSALAVRLGLGFVMVRKKGKSPPPVLTAAYEKEYGEDILEISSNALQAGDRVLVVDDVIATGGSAVAAIKLVQQCGAVPTGFLALSRVDGLQGLDKLTIPSFVLFD